MKRRLAVIMMADMVDYTRLMEVDQGGTIGLIGELRERWLEPEAERRGGEVLKRMGDGWIFAFSSTTDAVAAAQTVQTALAGHDRIKLRIAAHLGEIAEDETDFYGTGINIAARLQTEAPPGGVMISGDLHRQLDIAKADEFGDAGSFNLKNIAQPVAGFHWRPETSDRSFVDDVPVIAVAPVAATPETGETAEAAADMQEQLLHRLSLRTGIRVMTTDGGGEGAATYILRARLRTRGSTARATLTLIRTVDGQVAWSATFDGDGGDPFGFCDDVVDKADFELRTQINAFDGERLARLPDDSLSPSELRARAAQFTYHGTMESYRRSRTLMERALRLDPDNAMNRAMWAECVLWPGEAAFTTYAPETVSEIVRRANRAVQGAPRTDYVYFIRAHVRARLLGDVAGARKDVQRMKRINPGYTLGFEAEGQAALAAGDWDLAVEAFAECVDRSQNDPYLPMWIYELAFAQLMAGKTAEAAASIGDAIELRPECRVYRLLLVEIHARAGTDALAEEAREVAAGLTSGPNLLAPRLPLPPEQRAMMLTFAPSSD